MKVSQNEIQSATSRRFSLRSILLLVLLVGVGAGATAYAVGSVFAANGATNAGPIQQNATSASATTTAHNCTLTSA